MLRPSKPNALPHFQLQAFGQDINPRGYSKWPLERFVQAAYEGDLELLSKMLDREDPIEGYHHDFNAHHKPDGFNALHAAATAGQLEAVQMLLKAGVDPHVKRSMPEGQNPKDGETAREMADKHGWDDIAAVLKEAEKSYMRGLYKEFGWNNNAKLWPIDRPEGLDPDQEKRRQLSVGEECESPMSRSMSRFIRPPAGPGGLVSYRRNGHWRSSAPKPKRREEPRSQRNSASQAAAVLIVVGQIVAVAQIGDQFPG
ncbi:unnamed protein product [Effrenium voratum]|nr:unnamed protein product [Effrenium voratum]